MEMIDILDEYGNAIGEVQDRNIVHQIGLWHKVVYIWIINSRDELLIQKRSPNKDKDPNLWTISAYGHLSAGDSSKDGALRELYEELGIHILEEELKYLFTVKQHKVHREDYIDNEIIDVYLVKKDINLKDLTIQKEEVSEIKLIPYNELKNKVINKDNSIVEHTEMYNKLFSFLENKF